LLSLAYSTPSSEVDELIERLSAGDRDEWIAAAWESPLLMNTLGTQPAFVAGRIERDALLALKRDAKQLLMRAAGEDRHLATWAYVLAQVGAIAHFGSSLSERIDPRLAGVLAELACIVPPPLGPLLDLAACRLPGPPDGHQAAG
jgi:hypothetical protein